MGKHNRHESVPNPEAQDKSEFHGNVEHVYEGIDTAVRAIDPKEAYSWYDVAEDGTSFVEGGDELKRIVEKIDADPSYVPKPYEVALMDYMESELARLDARARLDMDSLRSWSDMEVGSEDMATYTDEEVIAHRLRAMKKTAQRDSRQTAADDETRSAAREDFGKYSWTLNKFEHGEKGMPVSAFVEAGKRYEAGDISEDEYNDVVKEFQKRSSSNETVAAAYKDLLKKSGGVENPYYSKAEHTDTPDEPADDEPAPISDPQPEPTPEPQSVAPEPVPISIPNAPARIDAEAQRLIELDIRNNYEAAKESLAKLSARDGMRWFRKNNPEEVTAAHDRFTRSIQEMMQIDPEGKAILTNPNLPPERRASLINSFYLAKHAELRKATTDEMANTPIGKASEFVRKHKKMVALGAIGLSIATGGLGGVVAGGAFALGINKAAKYEQKGREKLADGKFDIDELNQFTQENGGLSVGMDYFGLIARNMQHQMERDVIKAHRKRLVGSVAVGAAWAGGAYFGAHAAVAGVESAAHQVGGWFGNSISNLANSHPNGYGIKYYQPNA